ncbi:MAG: DUF4832 domain-containing protein [Candidatus Zipacnadales bacterium]
MVWVGLTAVLLGVLASQISGQEDRVIVHPPDTGELFDNPGMGWVLHFYDNVPTNYGSRLEYWDTLDDFPALGVIYLRIPWSYIEPEEGRFNWSVVDTPSQKWIAKGKRIALRFSCSESWCRYATPQWVEAAGANGYNFRPGIGATEDGPFWEPDYDDPIFLEKLDQFLAAVAERYDGHPQVAWIDVGSFGVWGEGHTYHSSRLPYSAQTIIRHIDLHLKHFKHTLLAANDDFRLQNRGEAALDYALEQGLTLRDDSILVQPAPKAYLSADLAERFWRQHPIVLESEHYGGSRDRGNWQDGSLYLEALEQYHASYPSIHWWPPEFLEEQRALIERMSLRMGYRLQLVEASWATRLTLGSKLTFTSTWRNAGVAPCYPSGFPTVILRDERGGLAAVFVDREFDLRDLPVAPPGEAEIRKREATFELPFNLRPGEYDLWIAVGDKLGLPKIRLPLPDGDEQLRYRLGKITVIGHYGVEVGELQRREKDWLLPVTWTIHAPLPAGSIPFCHFEREGKIVFFGRPDADDPAARLALVGVANLGVVIEPPKEAWGQTYRVLLGLWVPERAGREEERIIPERGQIDRRVLIGELKIGEDGSAMFISAR